MNAGCTGSTQRGPAHSWAAKASQGHLSHLMDNAYSKAKFRPGFKTFSSV